MGGSSGLAGRMLRRWRRAGGDAGLEPLLDFRGAWFAVAVGVGGGGGALAAAGADEECRDEKRESLGKLIRDGISATTCLGLRRLFYVSLLCADRFRVKQKVISDGSYGWKQLMVFLDALGRL